MNTRPQVGEPVRLTAANDDFQGNIGTLKFQGNIGTLKVDDQSNNPFFVTGFDPANEGRGRWFTEDQIESVKNGSTLTVSDVSDKEKELAAALERAQQRLEEQQGKYRHDMQHWEATLRATKEDQSWCDEGTNEVIETLNEGFIGGWEIEPYATEFDIEVTISGYLNIRRTVTISATSEEDAREKFDDDRDAYLGDDPDTLLTEAARHTSFEDVECEIA